MPDDGQQLNIFLILDPIAICIEKKTGHELRGGGGGLQNRRGGAHEVLPL